MINRRFALGVVFFTALMDSIGFGIILPVTPTLLMEVSAEGLSTSAVYGGWLMFSFAIMQFVSMPVLGNLSDAYGRKPVLLGSLLVLSINYLIMGLAQSLVLLFIGRLISGIGSATFSTCNAYIADTTSVEERAQFFGLMGAAFGLGFVIGPVLGGVLGEYGSRVPFFATAVLIFFNLIIGLVFLPESHMPNNRRPFEIRRANPFSALKQMSQFKIAFGIIGVLFLYNMGHHALPAVWTFWGIEKFDWTPREIGYSLGFIGILMVFSQGYLIRIVIPALGMRWAGVVGLSFTITAFLGYAVSQTPTMAYMFMIAGALGGLASPAMSGIASSQVGPDQQGELQGAIGSIGSLTNIISPLLMTMVFGFYTGSDAHFYFPGAPFILAAMLTMMSLVLFFRITVGFSQKETVAPL
ncbi:TCR/Tet family MFS transporter [Gammaproteobacteria bacterium]|nr:TCR/Tet family MFS transporter [Gammaproteobacteria bacterium]